MIRGSQPATLTGAGFVGAGCPVINLLDMENNELLKVTQDGTSLVITENTLYIGSDDPESTYNDLVVEWRNDTLRIDGWDLSPVMIKVLKEYISKEI